MKKYFVYLGMAITSCAVAGEDRGDLNTPSASSLKAFSQIEYKKYDPLTETRKFKLNRQDVLNYLEKNKREDFESLDNPYGKLSIEIILDGFGQGMIPEYSIDESSSASMRALVKLGYMHVRRDGKVVREFNNEELVAHAAKELQGKIDNLKWKENPDFFEGIMAPSIQLGLNDRGRIRNKKFKHKKKRKAYKADYEKISRTTKTVFRHAFNGQVPSDENLKNILTDETTTLREKAKKVSIYVENECANNRGTIPAIVWTKNDQDNQMRKSMLNGESRFEVKDIVNLKKQYGLTQNDLEIKELKKLYAELVRRPSSENRFFSESDVTNRNAERKYDFDLQGLNEEFIEYFYNNMNQGYIPQGLSETPKNLKNKDTKQKISEEVLETSFESLSEAISNTKRVIDPDITAKLLHKFGMSAWSKFDNQAMFNKMTLTCKHFPAICKARSAKMPPASAKHYMVELWKHLKQWELPDSPDFKDAYWILDSSPAPVTDDVIEHFFSNPNYSLRIAAGRWARLMSCINKTYENGIRRYPELVRRGLRYHSDDTYRERDNILVKDPPSYEEAINTEHH